MRESPRIRRLRADLKSLEQVKADSSILDFTVPGALYGGPPESYLLRFRGKGLWRPEGGSEVLVREQHEIVIHLGAGYPRMMPELNWRTPVFHPNISAGGVVCLGGYGTHWVPSVNLDELCSMLWDMIRYRNFDVNSPYNREAALWAKSQRQFPLPIDSRPLRDRLAGQTPLQASYQPASSLQPASNMGPQTPEILFIGNEIVDAEIVDAEIVASEGSDVLYIE